MIIITHKNRLKYKYTVDSGDFQLSWSRINQWIRKAVKSSIDTTSYSILRVNETQKPIFISEGKLCRIVLTVSLSTEPLETSHKNGQPKLHKRVLFKSRENVHPKMQETVIKGTFPKKCSF